MFSFTRLRGADPVTGVEMASTGEVGCIGSNFDEALLLSLEAAKVRPPQKGVLVSAGSEENKLKFLEAAECLKSLKIPMYATAGTAKYLAERGYEVTTLPWPDESDDNVIKAIKEGVVDFVVNLPKNSLKSELTNGTRIRQAAVTFDCPLLTDMKSYCLHQSNSKLSRFPEES